MNMIWEVIRQLQVLPTERTLAIHLLSTMETWKEERLHKHTRAKPNTSFTLLGEGNKHTEGERKIHIQKIRNVAPTARRGGEVPGQAVAQHREPE